jgi:hypothetical protein
MIAVAASALVLASIILACRWLHLHDGYISVGRFMIRF